MINAGLVSLSSCYISQQSTYVLLLIFFACYGCYILIVDSAP